MNEFNDVDNNFKITYSLIIKHSKSGIYIKKLFFNMFN